MLKGRLGRFIKKARIFKNFDQKKLALMLKKTTSSISQLESGSLLPGDKFLADICSCLELDYMYAWHMAQVEKAKSSLARQVSLQNLKNYELLNVNKNTKNLESKQKKFLNYNYKIFKNFDTNTSLKIFDKQNLKILKDRLNFLTFDLTNNQSVAFIEYHEDDMSPIIEKGDLLFFNFLTTYKLITTEKYYLVANENGLLNLQKICQDKIKEKNILYSEKAKQYILDKSFKDKRTEFLVLGMLSTIIKSFN